MKTIRWGIIGCGTVTEHKSGPAFQQVEQSSLTPVMRRDGEKAKDYAERHAVPRWYDRAEDLIMDEEVDAVYIATPPLVTYEIYEDGCRSRKAGICRETDGKKCRRVQNDDRSL
ncbi:Gfo/Idh/MocA family oxidoreductase [Salimicrobium jeotgali]|uniref:Gfo/Idh/MocA family oxidoreductase n=1 Tax=Salimicrobium jeotgali TaxID=1230341 RepID=UPI0027E3B6AF|nr:Gfo/Idh/MocA family oxidoreductase [Salimicrobium jeotgali]